MKIQSLDLNSNLSYKYLFRASDKNQKFCYISIAKILAVYSVVILHTNHKFWNFNFETYKTYWISANLIETIFYFAVPFFALCIGATLLDFNEKYGIITYYKKRIIKLIIPLLSWNIITYYYRVYILKNLQQIKFNFRDLWNLYYSHKVNSIFGSLHDFILLYMIIPLIAYVEKSKKIKIYLYCFIFLLLCQSFFPYIINVFHLNLYWIYNINIRLIIYIFAGYIIHNYNFNCSIIIIIYILGLYGFLIHLFGTKILTIKYKQIIILHKGYMNFPCVLYSCSLFLFIKENSSYISKFINQKYINKVGSLTFGPFFMHMPILNYISKLNKVNEFSLNYRLYGGIIICTICLIMTYIFQKIPILKYLVP